MEKKTAVEWLLDEYFGGIENCRPDFKHHIEQAKAKEKEQIENAFLKAYLIGEDDIELNDAKISSKYYYKKTYENN